MNVTRSFWSAGAAWCLASYACWDYGWKDWSRIMFVMGLMAAAIGLAVNGMHLLAEGDGKEPKEPRNG